MAPFRRTENRKTGVKDCVRAYGKAFDQINKDIEDNRRCPYLQNELENPQGVKGRPDHKVTREEYKQVCAEIPLPKKMEQDGVVEMALEEFSDFVLSMNGEMRDNDNKNRQDTQDLYGGVAL